MRCARLLFAFRRSAKRPCRSAKRPCRSAFCTFTVDSQHFHRRRSAHSPSTVSTFTVDSRHIHRRQSALSPSTVGTFTVDSRHSHRRWSALSSSAVGPFTVDSRHFHRQQSALSWSMVGAFTVGGRHFHRRRQVERQRSRQRHGVRQPRAAFARRTTFLPTKNPVRHILPPPANAFHARSAFDRGEAGRH